ncbi:hypothetical protein NWE59_02250 [Mycoplasmopsis felis]|uniref:hypothetical protein n=1 Tax=Mycoplasmopsis felis TaxID=33923 RepID=UPI0021AE4923|nr:hypothetical protein [Mycoplasmopsis felis]UWV78880.1 hypothetical protein NWE59_02250 [Mycoplasmopsis felis]
MQLYKVNSEVFLGIANGGNKVDNKLFELTDPSLERDLNMKQNLKIKVETLKLLSLNLREMKQLKHWYLNIL